MPKKQTSDTISSLAGAYARKSNAKYDDQFYPNGTRDAPPPEVRFGWYKQIRKMAASLIAQDETKGKRK